MKKSLQNTNKTIDEIQLISKDRMAVVKASELLKKNFPIEEVILFGSKARGDDDQESDIDLLLLTSQPLHWKEREAIIRELFDIEMTYDVVISILDTTLSDWNNGIFTIFPIHSHIRHDGVIA